MGGIILQAILAALAAVSSLVLAGPASAHLIAKPKSSSLDARLTAQTANVVHARGFIRWAESRRLSARAPLSIRRELRWARAAVGRGGWLLEEVAKTETAIQRRDVPRDYASAVRLVERFYGAQPFLWACPRSEGGFGPWVPNRQGSGAGGWLQFMAGTFYGIIDEAITDARSRGMLVPSSARSWYSPLGQALAGRQMIENGRRGEWSGSTC